MSESEHIIIGNHYIVSRAADGIDQSGEIPVGVVIKALESAPMGSLDVIAIECEGYDEPTVFAYQLENMPHRGMRSDHITVVEAAAPCPVCGGVALDCTNRDYTTSYYCDRCGYLDMSIYGHYFEGV